MEPLVATQIGVAAVQDVVFATAAGCLACAEMGKRSGMGAPTALRIWQTGLSIVLALTALAYLWLQAAVMSGSPLADAGAAVSSVLTESHFGFAWSVAFVGALLATLSWLSGRWGLPLFIAGLVAWAAGKAAASHAADAGDLSVREAIHVMHLCATALWAGSVIVAAIMLRGPTTAHATADRRLAFCAELSYLATAALVVVLITGFYNVLQDTGEADVRFFATPWGRILAAKLVCVAAAVGLGGWNRLVVLPKLHAQALRDDSSFAATQKRFDVLLSVEALAMLVILTIAAVLGHTAPTRG
ncbi:MULTISPECIES: CopD family protein [unclassified Caballeronia]|uniref:CopD family protein n=1 Tax=unclassified Caballeronia TaxID=2646786 RepID=UPI0028649A9A|nr:MULTISPECIES: CopD family protein [unclassified Caballeronia]MDR5806413.1 CopD family protein [Caballeronia sp. LZ001]MDR5853020.1 CopD family protein [Caballeronia sp. LZ003]